MNPFLLALASTTGRGILISLLILALTGLTFVLVKVASYLYKNSGVFTATAKRLAFLDEREVKLDLDLENASKREVHVTDMRLGFLKGKHVHGVTGFAYPPLAKGSDVGFVTESKGIYDFRLAVNDRRSVFVEYHIPSEFVFPADAAPCLYYHNARGALLAAKIDLRSTDAQLLEFHPAKRKKPKA